MLDSGGWSLVVAGGQDKIALAVQESSGVLVVWVPSMWPAVSSV